jgi:hypothetical protein
MSSAVSIGMNVYFSTAAWQVAGSVDTVNSFRWPRAINHQISLTVYPIMMIAERGMTAYQRVLGHSRIGEGSTAATASIDPS